jgi:hypothetical protein
MDGSHASHCFTIYPFGVLQVSLAHDRSRLCYDEALYVVVCVKELLVVDSDR